MWLQEHFHCFLGVIVEPSSTTVREVYISKLEGSDTADCGAEVSPCNTLKYSLELNNDSLSLHVHIDGTGTKGNFYYWPPSLSVVYKNFTLEGHRSVAHIKGGTARSDYINIYAPRNQTPTRILIKSIAFHGAKLKMTNYSDFFIRNCNFLDSSKSVIIVYKMLGKTLISISQSTFKNNTKCVIISPHKVITKDPFLLKVYINSNTFTSDGFGDCNKCKKSAFTLLRSGMLDETVILHIRNVSFTKSFGHFLYLGYLNNKHQKRKKGYHPDPDRFYTKLFIINSTFQDNQSPLGVLYLGGRVFHRGLVNITKSSFLSNSIGLIVTDNFLVFCNKITVNFTKSKGVSFKNSPEPPKHFHSLKWLYNNPMQIVFTQCIFGNNSASVEVKNNRLGKNISIRFLDTVFYGNGSPGFRDSAIHISSHGADAKHSVRRNFTSNAVVIFERVKVKETKGIAILVGLLNLTKATIKILDCEFTNNNNYKPLEYKGPVMYLRAPSDIPNHIPCARKQRHNNANFEVDSSYLKFTPGNHQVGHSNPWTTNNDIRNKFPAWNFRGHTLIQNSRFRNNVGHGGILMLRNGETTVLNTTFYENIAISFGGVITVTERGGSLRVYNSTFARKKVNTAKLPYSKEARDCFILFQSGYPLIINSSLFTTRFTTYMQPVFEISKQGFVNVDKLSSFECPVGKELKVEKSSSSATKMYNNTPCVYSLNSTILFCQKCNRNWYSVQRGRSIGLNIDSKSNCLPCPYGAICSDTIVAKLNFWGYVASVNPLVLKFIPCPHHYCNGPPVNHNRCTGNRVGRLCGQCKKGYTEDLISTECRSISNCNGYLFWPLMILAVIAMTWYLLFKPPVIQILWKHSLWFRKTDPQYTQLDEERVSSGLVKVIFYFYQIAELLLIISYPNLLKKIFFVKPIMAFFNFHLFLFSDKLGCPFPGLTVVTKELFISLNVFGTIVCLFPIFILNFWFNKLQGKPKPNVTHYIAASIEILLLGYDRLAEVSFKLLQCVRIGNKSRLFYDGNIECWQWWQYLFVTYVVVFIVPFIVTLYWGSIKIHRREVSNKEFVGACCVPLPFIIYWIFNHCKGKVQRKEYNNDEIKEILHKPFRAPTENCAGTLQWESVLIGRRFLLVCLYSFILDPMVRLLCLNFACAVILVHHLLRKPFKDAMVNKCETTSLLALVLIATSSVAKATLISNGTNPEGPTKDYLLVLQWIELGLLSFLPLALLVLVILALVSQAIRLLISASRLLRGLVRAFSRPLFV